MHVVCPHCNATNRVPAERFGGGAKCGKCKLPIFTAHPLELTSANFQAQIWNSELPVLVDFWAPWCGPCRMMAPAFEAAAAQLEPQFRLAKLNSEEEQAIAQQYDIRSIPTLVLFKEGREIARQAGAMTNPAQIGAWARAQL